MYSVLLVDDEPWITFGIKKLIEWETIGFTIIGEAASGSEAWNILNEKHPDVLISDIRMPGLDGLELLEKIRDSRYPTRVIFMSGFAEFAYAQKALQLGAFDYLLKPVDRIKLTETMKHLRYILDVNFDSGFADFDSLYDILKPESRMTIREFLYERNLPLCPETHGLRFLSCIVPQIETFKKFDRIKTLDYSTMIRLRTGTLKFLILYHFSKNEKEKERKFIQTVAQFCTCLGLSGAASLDARIGRVFYEADIALYSERLVPHEGIRFYVQSGGQAVFLHLQDLEKTLRDGDIKAACNILLQITIDVRQKDCMVDRIALLYNQIIVMLHRFFPQQLGEMEFITYHQICYEYGSPEELFGMLETLLNALHEQSRNESSPLMKKVRQEIETHFTENISLSILCRKFNLSIGYLSALIKRETGKTYTELITEKRVDLAKQLLKNTDESVYEIVQRVGYNDYFYFNKLFKKTVGITPGRYRRQ